MSKIRTPRKRSALTGGGDALDAAVDAAARLLDRHEQQVAVNRDVALAARADDRGHQLRPARVLDVVDVEAVEVADEQFVPRNARSELAKSRPLPPLAPPASAGVAGGGAGCAAAGFAGAGAGAGVGLRRRGRLATAASVGARRRPALWIEEAGRLRHVRDELHVPRRNAGVLEPGFRPTRGSLGSPCGRRLIAPWRRQPRSHRGHDRYTTAALRGAPSGDFNSSHFLQLDALSTWRAIRPISIR